MKLFGSTSDNLSWDIVWRNSGDFFSFNIFQPRRLEREGGREGKKMAKINEI